MAPSPALPDPALGAAAQADALSALIHLGYGQAEAAAAVAEASGPAEAAGAEALIRAALRRLAPQG
jgi:Holliday junction DNA helicase RuvA